MNYLKQLRFRQVHLDFHTSPLIDGIGEAFDRKAWQETLKAAHVDSITLFSTCHHGYCYHPTKVGRMHPGLKFNLLREQMDACHEIGVRTPVYISAGFSQWQYEAHPEWLMKSYNDDLHLHQTDPLNACFRKLCFNTPYLDYLCDLTREVVEMFPDADGVLLDIINQPQCVCQRCLEDMEAQGLDPHKPADRRRFGDQVLMNYYRRLTEAARSRDPKMPVFHNSGNVTPGNNAILPYFSHLELESLPTGGWGYDHYPMSAAYCRKLPFDFLGMTGKFHTTWGEFGGFKHPNALKYECDAMLAYGSKCSIGDQLHPDGRLDESTYRLIGQAYADVEEKEPWCRDVQSAANIAILSNSSCTLNGAIQGVNAAQNHSETGANRLLLESHLFFDFLDCEMPLDGYDMLVMADDIRVTPALKAKVDAFLARGGRLVLSGKAGLWADKDGFAFDIQAEDGGDNDAFPDYIQAAQAFAPDGVTTPFVMYDGARKIRAKAGAVSLGQLYLPYFTRAYNHFCSHQHTPFRPEPSGYDAGVLSKQILYFAHPVFKLYNDYGSVILKHFVAAAIKQLLGDKLVTETNLPSQGRVTLMHQPQEKRYVLHLLYANTVLRGCETPSPGHAIRPTRPIEVIEELNPLPNVTAAVRLPAEVKRITLEPQGTALPLQRDAQGRYRIALPELTCHQMVVFAY